MEWTDKQDINLCGEVLVMEPYQYPYRSKERGDVWNNIAIKLNGLVHPRFKVSKRSVRDRLTLLITKYKAKVRKGGKCLWHFVRWVQTRLSSWRKLANEKCSEAKNKEKEEKTAAEERRKAAMDRLSQTKRTWKVKPLESTQKKIRRSSSDVVEYLKQKQELESDHRKEEMQLRKEELKASVEQQRQQNGMMKNFMEQQHQQTKMLLSLLVQKNVN